MLARGGGGAASGDAGVSGSGRRRLGLEICTAQHRADSAEITAVLGS